ncbi:hypothetical protein Zmor_015016 [Zophobas morio]|uniref:Uncharacterized protein n=1 Tax=Zophobas morio TaxID=2755281 RepID=A0AA38III0_9CUCU|nr:hypothetical protein Zmor_015016 [Zophobas morio]
MAFSEQHKIFVPTQNNWSNFFYGNINTAKYRDEILSVFLNQLDDEELVYGYFQQDGAHTTGATLENVANAVRRRARLCLQEGGSHFQHLL